MKWRISFEIELPTTSQQDVEKWAEFVLGFNSALSGSNPCVDKDLPARWEDLNRHSLRVTQG